MCGGLSLLGLSTENKGFVKICFQYVGECVSLLHSVEDKHKLSANLYQLNLLLKSSCFLSFPISQAYLEEKNLFHGDIAARNVLLHHNFTAKLCGLGLTYEAHTYGASSVAWKVPVKWQAPERLLSKPPTIKADMYGFILGLEVHLPLSLLYV